MYIGEFPGGPVVRTLSFHCHGLGSIPGQETKVLQDLQCRQKKEEEKKRNTHREMITVQNSIEKITGSGLAPRLTLSRAAIEDTGLCHVLCCTGLFGNYGYLLGRKQ